MQIKTIVEKDDKSYEFVANLTPEQHAFLINFAITTMMKQGIIPFKPEDDEVAIDGVIEVQH